LGELYEIFEGVHFEAGQIFTLKIDVLIIEVFFPPSASEEFSKFSIHMSVLKQ
jgi:hypothetical protein